MKQYQLIFTYYEVTKYCRLQRLPQCLHVHIERVWVSRILLYLTFYGAGNKQTTGDKLFHSDTQQRAGPAAAAARLRAMI